MSFGVCLVFVCMKFCNGNREANGGGSVFFGYPLATRKNGNALQSDDYKAFFVLEAGLEPAQPQWPRDFKSLVSTNSTIRATKSDKRDLNPRPRPWQGRALPTELLSHGKTLGRTPLFCGGKYKCFFVSGKEKGEKIATGKGWKGEGADFSLFFWAK